MTQREARRLCQVAGETERNSKVVEAFILGRSRHDWQGNNATSKADFALVLARSSEPMKQRVGRPILGMSLGRAHNGTFIYMNDKFFDLAKWRVFSTVYAPESKEFVRWKNRLLYDRKLAARRYSDSPSPKAYARAGRQPSASSASAICRSIKVRSFVACSESNPRCEYSSITSIAKRRSSTSTHWSKCGICEVLMATVPKLPTVTLG